MGQLNLPSKFEDPWLIQAVTRLALEKLITQKHPLPQPDISISKHLTADEHNALRYAAGYVLRSLKKYTPSNPALVSWLGKQTNAGSVPTGDSYLEFTKVWVNKVNRGGLFVVSDNVYEVFLAMEIVLRQFLKDMSDHQGLELLTFSMKTMKYYFCGP